MTGITTYLSILTLNVTGLNSPLKRNHLANWIKKEDPVAYRRPISSTESSTGLAERLEEDLPSQWSLKTGNTYHGQSRLQTYIDQTR
jgi:hypothetical protein